MLGRVLVLSASVGAGHLKAAEAIEKAISLRKLASDVQHLDVLKYTNKAFRHIYAKLYIDLVNNMPEVLGWLYDHLDNHRENDLIRGTFDRLNANPFIRYLHKYRPDIVICTHFLPAGIISSLKGEGKVKVLNAVVVTDFDIHAMWLCRYVEQYFVALEETQIHLKVLGVPQSIVTVSGIPIDPAFMESKDIKSTRQKHNLDPNRFTILVSAGGFGVGPIGYMIQALSSIVHPVQVVVVCGRNELLKAKLIADVTDLRQRSNVTFTVLGFTTAMDELMTSADLFVGKPGGLTTSEVLAKGVPIVVVNPIPGQEERNSDHLLEQGAAIRCNNLPTLSYKIESLINAPEKLVSMSKNARMMGKPDAVFQVLERLVTLTRDGQHDS